MRPSIPEIFESQWISMPISFFENATKQFNKKRLWSSSKNCSSLKLKNPENNLKNYIPIQCSTKRSDSVLVENFLIPLEICDEHLIEKETIKPKRSIFSGNMKKKISPMENDSIIKKNNIKSNNILNNSKKSNICNLDSKIDAYDEEQGDLVMLPTLNKTAVSLNPLEIEAKRILLNLGITTEMLENSVQYGPRCDIIGIFKKKTLFLIKIKAFDKFLMSQVHIELLYIDYKNKHC